MASITQVNGKWRALIRKTGHKSICKTFKTKAEATRFATKIEADLDAGKPVNMAVFTLNDMVDEYRKLRGMSRPISDQSNEHYMLKALCRVLGEIDVMRMSPDDLVAYAAERRDNGAGPYTINMEMSKLGTVIRYAAAAKKIAVPDAVGAARPLLSHMGLIGGGNRRERRPTEDELAAITKHLTEGRGLVYAQAVLFAVATAMRRGEVCAIKWADLDRDKRLILVRDRKDPRKKIGNHEWIPLLPAAWEIVKARPEGGDRIFPIHPQTLSKYFTETCRELKIPDLHFHDLRHEGTSKLFEEGYDIQEVSLVTGHKRWDNLKRYTNLKPESLHEGPSKKKPA